MAVMLEFMVAIVAMMASSVAGCCAPPIVLVPCKDQNKKSKFFLRKNTKQKIVLKLWFKYC